MKKSTLTESELRDMDWIERGRFRRASAFYAAKLAIISKASLLPADKLRALAAKAVIDGRSKYSNPRRKPTL